MSLTGRAKATRRAAISRRAQVLPRSTISLETAVDLLVLCRLESADAIPDERIRRHLKARLIENKPRAGGGVYPHQFVLTGHGMDQLVDSAHFEEAGRIVDAAMEDNT